MARLIVLSVGKFKNSPLKDVFAEYKKQLKFQLDLVELDVKTALSEESSVRKNKEGKAILAKIPDGAFVFALDERGTEYKSPVFAKELEKRMTVYPVIVFVIGGADGLSEEVRSRANAAISFGPMVWPHLLVRVMLIEQLYRAFAILSGHPYHRE